MKRTPASSRSLLAALPLFRALQRTTLERLSRATERLEIRRGDRVFSRGDAVTGMYMLVYGEVRLMAPAPRGRRLTSVVKPGSSFAEPMMFLERAAIVDAEAATDSLVLRVPRQAIFDELEHDPLFARRMIAALCQRIEALVREAERHALPSGRERLIEYLARNARPHEQGAVLELPGPKALVASHLHLTPEHFSRILHELAAEGLVKIRARRIEVPAIAKLIGDAARPAARRTKEKAPHDGASE